MKNKLLLLLFLFSFTCGHSQVVKAIHDGDSYKIKAVVDVWYRVEGIDCPEVISHLIHVAQPHGVEIGDTIRKLIKGKTVSLKSYGVDIYGRPRAQVFLEGVDMAELILRNGWGWYYRSNDLDKATRIRYRKLRDYAKRNRLGLWADEKPINPAEWRKSYRMLSAIKAKQKIE